MITFIVPTVGRPSLERTLASIELWPGDEILLVCDAGLQLHIQDYVRMRHGVRLLFCPPGGDWGHAERNFSMPFAKGQYIAHIDDDDVYAPNTRAVMHDAILRTPGRPVLFKMRFANGLELWQEQVIRCGNIGTPMFLTPNKPEMFGTWGSFVGGDCHFLETSKWVPSDYVWRPEVIALLRHGA